MRLPIFVLAALPVSLISAAAAPMPRLAVVISVDQMRADYLDRFAPFFVEGGFNRFRTGRQYPNCFYRHGVTKTGPGHAVILTGVHANVHGIIANEWRLQDWPNLEEVNCVEDREAGLLGLPPRAWRSPGGVLEAKSGRSPRHLLAPTVGDVLKAKYGPASKVFGVADKDRAAILMSGQHADGAYWTEDGRVVTSTYYCSALPDYIEAFNAEQRPQKVFNTTWDRLLDVSHYDKLQGPDDAEGESTRFGLGRTFPRRLDGGSKKESDFLEAFDSSPWDNDLVADLAQTVLVAEKLGQEDGAPDILAIGFSQTDKIGHFYGPDSHEVMDTYLRLDRTLEKLFAFIDEKVGLEHCVFVLTADHGAPPSPERRAAAGLPGARVRSADFDAPVQAALVAKFGQAPGTQPWTVRDNLGYRINPAALAATGAKREAAEQVIAEVLRAQPSVAAVYTRTQYLTPAPLDAIGEAMRLSFHAERSADVYAVLHPYFMERNEPGVTHGQPYEYDQNVPMAWFGLGIKPGRPEQRVGVDDIAPTLSGLLGVTPPSPAAKGARLF